MKSLSDIAQTLAPTHHLTMHQNSLRASTESAPYLVRQIGYVPLCIVYAAQEKQKKENRPVERQANEQHMV